jgi:hypothetical protein
MAEVFARVLGEALDVPEAVATGIVDDLRAMDPGLDDRFGGEREDPEADARRLYESLTRNEALVRWLENHARMARAALDTPAS